jgi:hypothetical protein
LTLLLVYIVGVVLVALPTFYLVRAGLGESSRGWSLPSLALAVIYLLLACWAAWHVHKAIGRRLG